MVYAQEHDELRASVRALVEKAGVRATIEAGGYDEALWRRMVDLDLPALAIAEEDGGVGYGIVELAVVLEEIGRANLPSPFLTTVVAGLALEAGRDGALPALARGDRRATVHLGCLVDGAARHVPDGDSADLLVLVGDGLVVDLTDDRVRRTPLTTMDLTRGQAHLDLHDVPARRLDLSTGAADRIASLAAVLVACEQIGGAERVLELSTGYARERVQFGRPIGSFQAVKHLLADMLIELELARSAQQHAVALAADPATPPSVLDAVARTARVACSRAFTQLTGDAIRVHGGIGYTWEHDLHLYFRRARASAVLFGGSADADALATHAGLVPTTAGERS
ncbi:acyl-CoA dehydrogenase family protein [Actinomycetospora atypica]|uniref:Acyl-CoA dehydrogenase family protein n=1 Tax=Actinomycetospora atypica TaxID=1290095 RepID=A0ABV9YJY4_9PSEU